MYSTQMLLYAEDTVGDRVQDGKLIDCLNLLRKCHPVSMAKACLPADALSGRSKEHASGPWNAGWLQQAHQNNSTLAVHLRGLPGQAVVIRKAPSVQPEDPQAYLAHSHASPALLERQCLQGHIAYEWFSKCFPQHFLWDQSHVSSIHISHVHIFTFWVSDV